MPAQQPPANLSQAAAQAAKGLSDLAVMLQAAGEQSPAMASRLADLLSTIGESVAQASSLLKPDQSGKEAAFSADDAGRRRKDRFLAMCPHRRAALAERRRAGGS